MKKTTWTRFCAWCGGMAVASVLSFGLAALYGFAWQKEDFERDAAYAVRAAVASARQGWIVYAVDGGLMYRVRPTRLAQGEASWYGKPYHGRRTASGNIYNMYHMTAAHRDLPFRSRIKVTNLDNGRSVVLKIDDRGPFAEDRIVDVSYKAAKELGMLHDGVANVRLTTLPEDGNS